jgi:hypothetical protein
MPTIPQLHEINRMNTVPNIHGIPYYPTLARFCLDCEPPDISQASHHAECRPAALSDLA